MVNFDRPRLQFDGIAVARQIIGALALDLDGGILRRDLLDPGGGLRQQVPDRTGTRPAIAGVGDPALGIVGVAFLAPAHRKAIALAAVHHERNRLGGLAQGDRQAPGGEWIERARMSGAFGLEQPLHDRDRMGRGHADRLVEHDPAVDVAPVAPRLVILARLLAGAPLLLPPPLRGRVGEGGRSRRLVSLHTPPPTPGSTAVPPPRGGGWGGGGGRSRRLVSLHPPLPTLLRSVDLPHGGGGNRNIGAVL